MSNLIRVRDKRTGHEYTTNTATATVHADLEVLDEPALDKNGIPRPPIVAAEPAAVADVEVIAEPAATPKPAAPAAKPTPKEK